ncbi:very-long-chain 3-oxoacyl-CoA reductase [Parasteatoda tepidariorum]|uniref:very-long-chain 3-oxoacyl-CoA reductase n=1 Tax=Parasteatoda tepidariorum TaxID=114398 RepID=UPI001C725B3B|nr:very-long-chain 3-oxoacyl-CoA reductase [Parasteatoda tepidariorum]
MTFSNLILSYSFYKWVGSIIVGVKLLKISYFILWNISYRIREYFEIGIIRPHIGKWAVITGGTDGIGKAYAEELAKRGFSICLISRNIEKLNTVSKELEGNYIIETKSINVDFTAGPEIYSEIAEELLKLEGGIGVLVNNVGMSYKYAEYFHAVPDGSNFMMNLINSNITSCTMMMKIVLPYMVNKKGIIINISSLLAVYPMPFLSTYAACKVYVDYLSKAVQYEYKDSGVIIQSVLPGYVATKMSNRKPRLEVPSAKEFVSSSIKTIGYESHTYGYIVHRMRGFLHEWLKSHMPANVNLAISGYIMRKNRDSYYKKQQKKSLVLE